MSDHFRHSLKAIAAVIVLLIAAFFWLKHKIHDVIVPPQILLPVKDKAIITYNENRHEITVTTPTGTDIRYGRNPTVEVQKDGTVKVNAHSWGVEVRPFLGLGYSDTGRAYVGCQFFYFRQFDASASFGWTADNRHAAFQPMVAIGWNFWSNSSLNLGINPLTIAGLSKPEPALFLSVRL